MDKQGRSRRDAHEDLFDVLEQDGDDPNLRCSQWCVCHKERSEKLLRYIDDAKRASGAERAAGESLAQTIERMFNELIWLRIRSQGKRS